MISKHEVFSLDGRFVVYTDTFKNLVYFGGEEFGTLIPMNLSSFTKMIKAVSDAFNEGTA